MPCSVGLGCAGCRLEFQAQRRSESRTKIHIDIRMYMYIHIHTHLNYMYVESIHTHLYLGIYGCLLKCTVIWVPVFGALIVLRVPVQIYVLSICMFLWISIYVHMHSVI